MHTLVPNKTTEFRQHTETLLSKPTRHPQTKNANISKPTTCKQLTQIWAVEGSRQGRRGGKIATFIEKGAEPQML